MSKVKSKEIENIDMVEENLFPEQMELPFSDSVQGNDRFIDNKVLKAVHSQLGKADTALKWLKDFNAHVRSTDPFYNVNQNKV
jgi:hypothetical protein|tara:strand:- start:271 stop:519 length:249 start_codon:yes stop_codon:yes gene_type:complete